MIGPGKLSTVWGAYEGYFREPSDQMGGVELLGKKLRSVIPPLCVHVLLMLLQVSHFNKII